ncbi:MAG: FtsW/RodA/SpoVE family cell cycle protein [Clostridium perfringens]|nr:FtsW/RodA/SpoVE family cell cycle protein [Clostridium perfringens]
MNTVKYERRIILLICLLCIGIFVNLALIADPVSTTALYMGGILIVVIIVPYIILRKLKPNGDKYILMFVDVLITVSIGILYVINSSLAVKQLIWFCVGLVIYLIIVLVLPDLKTFAKYKRIYLIGTLIFMAMSLVIGTEINGAKNWVVIGPLSFQPAEFGKLFLVLYLASVLISYKKKDKFIDDIKGLLKPILVVGYSVILMFLQHDLGMALMFFVVSLTILYLATSNGKYVLMCLVALVLGGTVGYFSLGYVRQRFEVVGANVWKYASGSGYQLVQGFYTMSTGGLFGTGLGNGYPSLVPEASTDFIYTIIAEQFGMIFAVGLMILYFLLFYRGIRSALYAKDKFSQLAVVGFSTMIVAQVLVIVGGVFAVIPLTGITLPMLSYGGTSMLTIFFALGILQKVSEEGNR